MTLVRAIQIILLQQFKDLKKCEFKMRTKGIAAEAVDSKDLLLSMLSLSRERKVTQKPN